MKLLVTGAWSGAQEHLDTLRQMGHEVIWMHDERGVLPCDRSEIEGVICNGLFVHHPMEQFSRLRYVQLTSAGFDRVPMELARERGITVHNAKGVYSIPMAEFALCGVLQLYKRSRFFWENQAVGRWEKHRGLRELSGKTVCIIGTGSVGTECAMRFEAFGCRVMGVNIRPRACAHFDQVFAFEQLNEVLARSDVAVLAVPLTAQTRHLMDQSQLDSMKPGAILVNLARGAVVNTQALKEALEKKLGGAVLDVFEQEPLERDSPLWNMQNVLVTPHNSFVSDGNQVRLCRVIMENLEQLK